MRFTLATLTITVLHRRKEYIELEQSVEVRSMPGQKADIQSSTELLSSLASYLSTFQHDLSDVSGQISELQQKSADIESQLKGRRVSKPQEKELRSDDTALSQRFAFRYNTSSFSGTRYSGHATRSISGSMADCYPTTGREDYGDKIPRKSQSFLRTR